MKRKVDILDEIVNNFEFSIKSYNKKFQSNHWLFNNKKKIKLFNKKNLINFRNNGLSEGMDDTFYSKRKSLKLLEKIKKECGEKFIQKYLLKTNLGNSKESLRYKSYFFTAHELFHLKFVHEIKKKVTLNKKDIICEIGPAYGSMISKLIKLYGSKVILIDLPEANFISYFYLKNLFPKKKFFVSKNIKNNKISKKDIIENDIIILCPWEKIPKIKINFFINVRSMMEMTHEVIKEYFDLIQDQITHNGYFLCVNRYYKDTVGYPVEMDNYPYDKHWKIIVSKTSWMQNHIHFLLTKRILNSKNDIVEELKKIRHLSYKLRLKDKLLIRRFTPNFIYKSYKKIKYSLIGK
tara:strand:- start:20 stop:1069 length:1050 start_codon:yes stop_codon:yes gene_type:complete